MADTQIADQVVARFHGAEVISRVEVRKSDTDEPLIQKLHGVGAHDIGRVTVGII